MIGMADIRRTMDTARPTSRFIRDPEGRRCRSAPATTALLRLGSQPPKRRGVSLPAALHMGAILSARIRGKNFLDFAEDRLVILKGNGDFELEWMDDWMRAFKANPSEFVNRPALESITPDQRVYLKHILDDNPPAPGKPGDFWRLDDPPWENLGPNSPHWERYRIRGILAELHLFNDFYRQHGFVHTPTTPAIDYIGGIAVQVKCTKNPMGAATVAKRAIDDLIDAEPTGPWILEVLVKPGSVTTDLEAVLKSHLDDFYDPEQVERFAVLVKDYSVVP